MANDVYTGPMPIEIELGERIMMLEHKIEVLNGIIDTRDKELTKAHQDLDETDKKLTEVMSGLWGEDARKYYDGQKEKPQTISDLELLAKSADKDVEIAQLKHDLLLEESFTSILMRRILAQEDRRNRGRELSL